MPSDYAVQEFYRENGKRAAMVEAQVAQEAGENRKEPV